MPSKLEFDGERFTPECEREIWYEHMHRYCLAGNWCAGKQVLDAACGEGYGSAILAGRAAHVTGVDLSPAAIEHATNRYGGLQNLDFRTGDVTRLPFDDQAFDVIVSFETLEHLDAQAEMLKEFRRVLRQDGFLVLSSPDKAEYSDRRGFHNRHHVKELYREELESLLSKEFKTYRILGQKLMFHSAIWCLDDVSLVESQTWSAGPAPQTGCIPHAPMYFLALCSAASEYLPESESRLWLFDDAQESIYQHYNREIQRVMTAGETVVERDREIEDLKRALGERKPWWQRLSGKN